MTFAPSALRYITMLTLSYAYTLTMATEQPRLVDGTLTSPLVPNEVEYFALLPAGYAEDAEPYPLVLSLHGGGGSRVSLRHQQPRIEALWTEESIPPMVFVTPSVTRRSFYMDFYDGSEKWESFIVGPLLTHLRERFNLREDKRGTMITGTSMGGMGSVRMAFKYLDIFGAVAAVEPAIEPIDDWENIKFKHRFWRGQDLLEAIFGSPIDRGYWNANNPATIVKRKGDAIRSSGLKIYIEVGDADLFWLYEGTEYLHQTLWDTKIRHEYKL